jgi:hypothetical protein
MDGQHEETTYISIGMAVRQTGLSLRMVQECVERRLVNEPLTFSDLGALRRIRRLRELGVNLSGIEIILHMRRRMQTLLAELEYRERLWSSPDWSESEDTWQRLLTWEPGEK